MTVNYKKYFPIAVAAVLLVGCSSETVSEPQTTNHVAYNQAETSHYDVVYRTDAIKPDGVTDDAVWETVPDISGSFHYPWERIEAPLTVFKAYADGKNFYFSFDVTDSEVLHDEWKDESTVDNEDRVELFFAGGPVDKPGPKGMTRYYATEVDPMGRAHDYSVMYYRDFDSEWGFKAAEYAAQVTDKGYTVEGIIPISELKDLELIDENGVMRVGVFRAEFSKKDKDDILMQWISWVDPKTADPDFHVDSAFGEFRFLNK